jgi:hypothetical protein
VTNEATGTGYTAGGASAVESISVQLQILHTDIKDERKETFGRLNGVEQRVSKLEAGGTWDGRNRRQ